MGRSIFAMPDLPDAGDMPNVRVEFYGLARLRAGTSALSVVAATVGEALSAAARTCPGLQVLREGRVSPEYLVSVGGVRFTTDPGEAIAEGESLLVMGADAGG